MPHAPISAVVPGHPDYEILSALAAEVRQRVPEKLYEAVAERALEAVEFVLDPIRTGRTRLAELDNVEKTFVGLKIEHFIRDLLDAPKGVRDLYLGNVDVDVKNTIGNSWCWMIPPETFRAEEPCLLIASHEPSRRSWMGLIVAREEYLGAPNRDGKRRINSSAFPNILWLANGVTWAADRWAGIDMGRFRELRRVKPGAQRAAMFFRENLRRVTHRKVLTALLWDQLDPMKRLRDNGGAKDLLREENVALLSGKYSNHVLEALGVPRIEKDEFVAIPITTNAESDAVDGA